MSDAGKQHIYDAMGVAPVVNAMGAVTLLGASSLSPRVMKAVKQANGKYVEMHKLLTRAGEMIAEILDAEAAAMTTGTTGGLVLSTAACMCGTDTDKISRLPDTTGMKNEFLFQRPERWLFERAVTQTGAKLVKVGEETGCTPEQLEAAIGPSTAGIIFVAPSRTARPTDEMVPLEEVVRIGRKHSVPVIVDGAGQTYPVSKMQRIAQAAELVCFGAKYIGGPNSAGYVCGRKDLVEAVDLQGFIGFDELGQQRIHGGIGRAYKIDRSEVVAAVVSLQEWVEMDHQARLEECEGRLKLIEGELKGVPHVATSLAGSYETGQFVLTITPDATALGKTARDIAVELAQGDPAVWVSWNRRRQPDQLGVAAGWGSLLEGEEYILAKRLRQVLTGHSRHSDDDVVYHPAFITKGATRMI